MNLFLLAAGVAAIGLSMVHIFPGGRALHQPMIASGWPAAVKAAWSVMWHAATAMMLIGGAALIGAASLPEQALALSIVPLALFLSGAALFLTYGLSRLGSVLVLPHWIAFLAISGLILAGLIWPA